MIKIYFKNTWVLFLFSLAINTTILQAQNSLTTSNKTNSSYEFHYKDIANFREVLNVAKQKGDTLQAIKQYFANGSGSSLDINVIDRFIIQQKVFLELIENSKKANLTKTKTAISISKLIKMRLGDTFRFIVAHNQRHLIQAESAIKIARS